MRERLSLGVSGKVSENSKEEFDKELSSYKKIYFLAPNNIG